MNLNVFLMSGYGVYVWSSFLLTFIICLFFFLKTRKTLRKLEKDFIKETQNLSEQKFKDFRKQKIVKEILALQSRT
tara:strand:+ start:806 stop:1033 length:228 start_codon:yes stop_codon:yes gene_type:complete